MNIVVVNDNGIKSQGIKELAIALKELGTITVIAPNEQKSGAGHCFTCDKAIKFKKIKYYDDIEGYVIYGTPKDCTDFACNYVFYDKKIDLIVSGINLGRNVGSDIICSGTCGAASTAINYGVPSIAFSLDYKEKNDFKMASKYALQIARWYLKQEFKKDCCLNVNIPNLNKEDIKGIVVSECSGVNKYHTIPQVMQEDDDYYVINVITNVENKGVKDLRNDAYALDEGYIVLTPLDLNLINYEKVNKIRDAIKEI